MTRHRLLFGLVIVFGGFWACGDGPTSGLSNDATVVVHYNLAAEEFVHLRIIDEHNDILRVLVDTVQSAGEYEVVWRTDFDSGGRLQVGQRFRVMIGTEEAGLRQTASFYFSKDGKLVAGEEDAAVASTVIHMGTL